MAATVTHLPTHEEDPVPTHPAPDAPPPEWRPLGLAEIAELLDVNEATPTRWKYLRGRTKFPPPDGHTSHTVPFWYYRTIETWARATKRWPGDEEARRRAEAATARDAAKREAIARRADADLARERLLVMQREAEEAQAAAEAAEAAARAADHDSSGSVAV